MDNTFVYLYSSQERAVWKFGEWVLENEKYLTNVNVRSLTAVDKLGNKHIFMGNLIYEQWCIGRSYYIVYPPYANIQGFGFTEYRSGYPVNNDVERTC